MATAFPRTFLITGVSSGLRRAFAAGAPAGGHQVIGTAQRGGDAEAFAALAPKRARPLVLDVTDLDAIPAAVTYAEQNVGPIDVLVNNAGYGKDEAAHRRDVDDMAAPPRTHAGQHRLHRRDRTDWAGRSMDRTPRSIADYDAVMDPSRAARRAKSGHQPGDPAKAALALLAVVEAPNPPVRLFLGDDALGLVERKLGGMKAEIAAWDEVSRSTNFATT